MINNSKEAYLQYRERARELYERCAVAHGESFGAGEVLDSIVVPQQANVQICEDGAFVEAIVWVPASKFERPVPIAPLCQAVNSDAGRSKLICSLPMGHKPPHCDEAQKLYFLSDDELSTKKTE